MEVLKKHNHYKEDRGVYSVLETVEIATGKREVLSEFDNLIEAPNWKKNGKELIYNSEGQIYNYNLKTGQSTLIESGYCNDCNNDHILSPDNSKIAVSHGTY
mgnify:CR=1 FL=1